MCECMYVCMYRCMYVCVCVCVFSLSCHIVVKSFRDWWRKPQLINKGVLKCTSALKVHFLPYTQYKIMVLCHCQKYKAIKK